MRFQIPACAGCAAPASMRECFPASGGLGVGLGGRCSPSAPPYRAFRSARRCRGGLGESCFHAGAAAAERERTCIFNRRDDSPYPRMREHTFSKTLSGAAGRKLSCICVGIDSRSSAHPRRRPLPLRDSGFSFHGAPRFSFRKMKRKRGRTPRPRGDRQVPITSPRRRKRKPCR